MKLLYINPSTNKALMVSKKKDKERTCDYCGTRGAFEYGVQVPVNQITMIDGAFCSIPCMRAKHNGGPNLDDK